jgi:hypothetical protein
MRTPRIALFAATAALVGRPLVVVPAGAAESNELTAERTHDSVSRARLSA